MGYLRLLLAISVVFAHSSSAFGSSSALGLEFLPGNMAVEIFFMISGFYMSLILSGKYATRTLDGLGSFYMSRFLRLWPAFLLTTAVCHLLWIAAYVHLGRPPTSAGPVHEIINNAGVSALMEMSNIFMIGQDVPALFHASHETGARLTFGEGRMLPDGSIWLGNALNIGPAWSIGAEIWFYMLVPFLARLSSPLLFALLAATGSLRYFMGEIHGLNIYFFFVTQLPLFLGGMLAHRLGSRKSRGVLARKEAAYLCLGLAVMASLMFGQFEFQDQRFKWLVYVLMGLTMHALFTHVGNSRAGRIIGELSYPIYIVHMLALSVLAAIGKRAGIEITSEILLLAVLPVSYLMYVRIDKPIGRYRERFARRAEKQPEFPDGILARP